MEGTNLAEGHFAEGHFGFEVMGGWEDSSTMRRQTWVRFFGLRGNRPGRDAFAFSRLFDPFDCLLFMCRRELRTGIALQPRGGHWDRASGYRFWVEQDLTRADREQIARISAAQTAASPPKLSTMRVRDDLTATDREQIAEILQGRMEEENL